MKAPTQPRTAVATARCATVPCCATWRARKEAVETRRASASWRSCSILPRLWIYASQAPRATLRRSGATPR